MLALLVWIAAEAWHGSLRPITVGDEGVIWATKAKLLFHAGGFGERFRAELPYFTEHSHLDYPALNPLLQLFAYVHGGELLHVESRFPINAFSGALLLALAGALRGLVRPALAAGFLLLVFATQEAQHLSRVANADLMVALGLAVALDGWLRWSRTGRPAWWRLCMLGCAFLAASKNEGVFAFACGVLAVAAARLVPGLPRPRLPARRESLWLALPLLVIGATWLTNARFDLENDIATSGALARLVESLPERIGPLLAHHARLVFARPEETNHLFTAFLLFVLLRPRRAFSGELAVPTLALALVLTGFGAVYLFSPHDMDWHLATSATRVAFQALPATALWLAHTVPHTDRRVS